MKRLTTALIVVLIAASAHLDAATVLIPGVEQLFAFGATTGPVPSVFEYFAPVASTIRVVDIGYEGDEFQFTIDGIPYLTVIPVPGPGDFTNTHSFDTAWNDPHLSRGTAYVGPGLHTIELAVVNRSQNTLVSDDGAAFIRADLGVPEPGSLALLASGLAGLWMTVRKKTRR